GVLLEILVESGATVPVGTAIARIGEPGAAAAQPAAGPAPAAGAAAPAAAPAGAAAGARPGSATGDGHGGRLLSPVVRRLAADSGIDLARVRGTGDAGRIRREDVEQAIASGTAAPQAPAPPPQAAPAQAPTAAVQAPSVAPAPTAAARRPAAAPAPAAAAGTADPRDQVEPLSRMRLAVADGMVRSLNTSAHVWTSVEVDFDNVERVRRKHKDRFRKEVGASLSYLPFVTRATIDALRAFPAVNSSI